MYADGLQHDPDQLLAIVGMAGRMPGADDVDSFWRLLMERGDAIRPVPPQRWDATAQLDPEKAVQAVGGFLDGVEGFDPTFFGISPREAADIDPQQRLMLETAWRALEDAGQPAAGLRGTRTGVYVGASWHDYEILRKERGAGATQHSAVGNALDVIAARVSYFLKLTGPSLTVETGCSSALVALHLAGQALRGGEIDAALVGGVNLIVAPDVSIGLTNFGGLSPDGRCKAFAASANGFVRGEGVVAVYLKTLARALADGDQVHAVIVATAVNNDGGGESLVTPSPAGQEDLLRRVYADAAVPPDALAYVEAHGTGTLRGDPIEAGAIGRVLGQRRDRARGPLGIGSVKTNIGHLEATAGLAGLVKSVLALEHRVVPPSLHAEELNPNIPFDELNLRVVREPLPLPVRGPVYVGVNSFGWGGTNAHVILSSAPDTPTVAGAVAVDAAPPVGVPAFVPLSAHDAATLRRRAVDLGDALAGAPGDAGDLRLDGIAAALGPRRDHFATRAAFLAGDVEGLRADLARFADDPEAEIADVVSGRMLPVGRTAFVFPGQGSQWAGMGRDLLAASPTFADVVRRCARALEPHFPWDLGAILSGEAGDEWLSRIDMLQPALWAMSVGLAELWSRAGVRPDVVVGHSQGEVAAATVAGILSYEDAALVVARRSAIARRTSGRGLMLAVDLDVAGARAALSGFEEFVSLAVNNGPTSCVLSGDSEAVLTLKELLDADGTFCRLVNVDYASHSPQMDELTDDLLAGLAEVRPRAGGTPLMSTVRVARLRGPEMDARYWVDNLRQPVLFADAMGVLFDEGVTHVVEISPHTILTPAVEQLAASRPESPRALPTLRRDTGAPTDLARAFAQGYVAGLEPFAASPDGSAPAGSSRDGSVPDGSDPGGSPVRTVAPRLPGYPWSRSDYWVDPGRRRAATPGALEFTLVPAATEQDTWQGTLELAVEEHPWLRDHQVHDAIVLPGVAMMAMALNAAHARHGVTARTLAAVRFRSDLTLTQGQGGEPATLSALWRDDVTEGGTFTLLSLPAGASGWTEHAVARVNQRPAPVEEIVFPEHLLDLKSATPEDFYAACSARGLRYGPAFHGIRWLATEGDTALAEVHLDDRCRAGARPHGLHPALWDGALQVALALCEGTETVVPTGLDQVVLLQDIDEPCTRLWSHAVRRTATQIDLHLFDADRRPLMIMRGLTLDALGSAQATGSDTERVHRLRFVAEPRALAAAASETGPQPGPAGPGSGSWVVCGAPEDGARELVDALARIGAPASWLTAPTDSPPERQASEPPTGWTGRLRAVGDIAGVVYLAPRGTTGIDAQRRGLSALAAIAASCVEQPTQPRLAVVTADAQTGRPADQPDPGAALFWGFARVLRREHPEIAPVVVDVAPADVDWAARCAGELVAGDGEDQVVLRGERRLVGRLVRGDVADPDDGESDSIVSDGIGAQGGAATAVEWRTPPQPFRLTPARPGFWDGLEYRPLRRRAPVAGEIEIEVSAAALNFIDVMKAMGTYPDPSGGAALLGGECAGRVSAVGPGVESLRPGDRVAACVMGSLASHVTVPAEHARPIPAGLDDVHAAGLPLVMLTAWYGLHDLARLGPDETVLIHSAAGGLGLAAVAVARMLGARVLATAGSEDKRRYLREFGVADVFDSRDLSWADRVREATDGRGVDVVLNSLTGAAIPLGLDVLAEDGRFIEVGKKDIYGGRTIGLGAFRKRISLSSVDLAGLMSRRPQRFARLFTELWDRVSAGDLAPLPVTTYSFAEAADALRTMAAGSHIGKFVLTDPASVRAVAPEPMPAGGFRPDGTYLVTGGLGALGLSLAEFLAERGAGAVALLGRSGPSEQAAARIEAIRAGGTRVRTFAVDVADAAALEATLTRLRGELPPLRGVVHAAGLLEDATVLRLRPEQIERVLAPKVDGARNLDAATTADPLDLFVMFSSAAALFGNAGQAAYAAGNAFMDTLAVARRRRGLPALSVQWGPFTQIGLAAQDANRGARLEERGMGGFTADDAWAALADFLRRDEQVVGYVPLNLRQWFDAYPDTAAQKSWQVLREAASAGAPAAAAGGAFLTSLRNGPSEARQDLVEAKVRELAGRVLRLDPKAIESQTPFKALGLDSLMSLELRNRLEATFGLTLSPTLLWTYGSSRALAGVLCERIFTTVAA